MVEVEDNLLLKNSCYNELDEVIVDEAIMWCDGKYWKFI